MKNIFLGKTHYSVLQALINKLKENDVTCGHHIFIVPDRMSVLCEKLIFEKTGISSTCNIEVLTLSRIALRLLKNKNVISRQASVMILQKVLSQHKNELKCFNKLESSALASEIYGTISQFKSCKIEPSYVRVSVKSPILQDKIDDIALLYAGYEGELHKRGVVDSLDKLNFLSQDIKNSSLIRNSRFYVCFFDGFTFQGYDIVSSIASSALEFNIGIPYKNALNEHIYNKNYLEKVVNFLGNARVQECDEEEERREEFKFILDNLFTFSPGVMKKRELPIKFFEGESLRDEIMHACMVIRDKIIREHYNLSDFNIAVTNLNQHKSEIENVLKLYDFNFFLDTQIEFNETILPKLISNAFDLYLENYSRKSVLKFLKNPLVDIDKKELYDFEDYVNNYDIIDAYDLKSVNIEESEFFEGFNKTREKLYNLTDEFMKSLSSARVFNDFVVATQKLFEVLQIEKKLDNQIGKFITMGRLDKARVYEQYLDCLSEIFDLTSDLLGLDACEAKDFLATFQSAVMDKKISTSPLSINAVFVGDTSVSFFERRKFMFIINMNEEEFPKKISDCGLITDDDISLLSDKYLLEPSIREINKKERYKCFELFSIPTLELCLSYNFKAGTRSKIFDDVLNLFNVENKGRFVLPHIQSMKDVDFYVKNNYEMVARLNLTRGVREIFDGQKKDEGDLSALYFALKSSIDSKFLDNFNYENTIKLKENVFFRKGKTSISEIESFMTCPFLHYARYGLKLQEGEKGEVDKLSIGNIMHRLAFLLLKNYNLPLDNISLNEVAKQLFDRILQEDDFKGLSYSLKNKIILSNLKEEGVRFARALNEQARYSQFKPIMFEARFDDNNKLKPIRIKAKDKDILLVGQIDRIDKYKDYFRVIDYKTGKTDLSLKELFFGKKIQLETYVSVVKNSLNLESAGSYYLPIKSSFYDLSKGNEFKKYALSGRTKRDDEVIEAVDTRLKENTQSDIIDVKFKFGLDGNREYNTYSHVEERGNIEAYSKYALRLTKKAVEDILTLNVSPSPLSLNADTCANCKFFKLCHFDENYKNQTRAPKTKIDATKFKKEEK